MLCQPAATLAQHEQDRQAILAAGFNQVALLDGARLGEVQIRTTGGQHGSDLALALGVIQWLFENDAADLEFLARHATGVDALRERADAAWQRLEEGPTSRPVTD